ncbi:MAG: ABC transporter permease subunit [Acidobacteria bacterium]|nr:ABC transporter permease subunit [Acidobacteriota bacterium]
MGASGLTRILAVASNTYRETVRERVLYNLVVFAFLMTLSGLLLSELSIREDEKIVKDVGLAAMDIFGTLIALFIGVGLVSKEIDRRSLHPLLSRPLRRRELLLGKFAGLGFTLLVNLGAMTAGLYLTLFATGRGPEPQLLKAVYGLYLGLLLVVALALLFSTLTSSVLAAVCTFSLVVAGRFSDVIRGMQDVIPGAPTWLVRLLYFAVPNFRNFDFKAQVVYGDPVPWAGLAWVTLYAAAYGAVALSLAEAALRHKDLP